MCQVIKVLILSRLKVESALIKEAQEGVDPVEKNSAENLKTLLLVFMHLLNYYYYYYPIMPPVCVSEACLCFVG